MENNQLPAVVEMQQKLPQLLNEFMPKLEKYSQRAHAALDGITKCESEDEAEQIISLLAAVSDVYKRNNELRTQLTNFTDQFKDYLMEFERPFDPTSGKKNKYNEKKKMLIDYQQKQLEKRREEEERAAKRRDHDNAIVEIKAFIRQNLVTMVESGGIRVNDGCKAFFEASTLETFDARAKEFVNHKPKLKQTDYDACFAMNDENANRFVKILQAGEFTTLIDELKTEEPYEKWNKQFMEVISPIINEWRDRIPEIKKQKEELAAAAKKSEADVQALKEKQKQENELRAQQVQQQLTFEAEQKKQEIAQEADHEVTGNMLQHQAATQAMADAGKFKLVLKFTDPKLTPKALCNMIYHVFKDENFAGIQKRDRTTKKLIVDAKGRPEYVDHVQAWIDLFLKCSKADIEGTQVFQDSTVTIRK